MTDCSALSPEAFVDHLRSLGLYRALFRYNASSGRAEASHPELEPLAEWLCGNQRDYAGHEAVFLEVGATTDALLGAFVHKTRRGQSAGGLRLWPYDSLGAFLTDGLRLSRGMSRKNALAGLWWGGGKGVIARQTGDQHKDLGYRRSLFADYAAFVTSLSGVYVTAEDVGTTPWDMAQLYAGTRYMMCAPARVGGSGNPSPQTARGVVCAMEAALDFAQQGSLEGKTIAMQGTGNVGSAMIGFLLERGVKRIVASEISEALHQKVVSQHLDKRLEARLVSRDDLSIFEEPCDILAPNALGGVLNETTIPMIQAPVVCGAANNQLLDDQRDAEALRARDILHVPDFVANRMGIVNCANEQYGSIPGDPAIERHFSRDWESSVHNVTLRVLERAQSEGLTPTEAANSLADELAEAEHPIFGHRASAIIRRLSESGWANGR